MATFILGLVIFLVGGALYGRLCERAFGPDDRTTPAIEKADGVDYVPMPKWRNSLINLLNIAGTGPILGPIQGILFVPVFFVTVACGILSGFHSTQVTLVTRTVGSEREGRTTFYNMMILEGTVAMVWAAASMAMIGVGAAEGGITMQMTDGGWAYFAQVDGEVQRIAATSVVGVACNKLLGPVGIVAIIGAIVLSVTSGDTAMRSLRLMVPEALGVGTGGAGRRLAVAAPLFALAACLLVWAKSDADGFGIIWRYSGWANQTLGVCALVTVTIWLVSHGKRRVAWMPLVPLAFYAFITCTFLLSARIGFNLPIQVAYAVGAIFAIAACALSLWWGSRRRE